MARSRSRFVPPCGTIRARGYESDRGISGLRRSSCGRARRARSRDERGRGRGGCANVVTLDDYGTAIYFIEEGAAEVLNDGGEATQALGPGDTFGEIATPPDRTADGHSRGAHADAAPLALRSGLRAHPSTCTRARTLAAPARPRARGPVTAVVRVARRIGSATQSCEKRRLLLKRNVQPPWELYEVEIRPQRLRGGLQLREARWRGDVRELDPASSPSSAAGIAGEPREVVPFGGDASASACVAFAMREARDDRP